MQPESPIHPVYLPFGASQLRKHFAPVSSRDQDQLESHFIPYARAAAVRSNENLEGPTHADAPLINEDNGFAVLLEAKVGSDISCDISFDLLRNQLVRCIDVALEKNDSLPHPLCTRDPERTLVMLQTPALFKNHSGSRLYGWLFRHYRNDPSSLAAELRHRPGIQFDRVAERLGWLTWEECKGVLPDACPWM
jgi:hypothetical protein